MLVQDIWKQNVISYWPENNIMQKLFEPEKNEFKLKDAMGSRGMKKVRR